MKTDHELLLEELNQQEFCPTCHHPDNWKWHGESCYYCGKPINNLAGNPTLWSIPLCHSDEPGKVKPHHIGCVDERLEKLARLEEQLLLNIPLS